MTAKNYTAVVSRSHKEECKGTTLQLVEFLLYSLNYNEGILILPI